MQIQGHARTDAGCECGLELSRRKWKDHLGFIAKELFTARRMERRRVFGPRHTLLRGDALAEQIQSRRVAVLRGDVQ